MNYLEVVIASLFYQFALYLAIRLAHRGFTLGELGLVCFGGTALCMELLNITIARVRISVTFSDCTSLNESLEDLAGYDTIHQDIPTAHTTAHLPNGFDRRLVSYRLPSCAIPGSLSPHCPATCSQAPLPRREATEKTLPCTRLLYRYSPDRGWPYWYMGLVVPWQTEPLALGYIPASGREEAVDPPSFVGVLGFAGLPERGRMEPAAG